jgi:hypothetical protein
VARDGSTTPSAVGMGRGAANCRTASSCHHAGFPPRNRLESPPAAGRRGGRGRAASTRSRDRPGCAFESSEHGQREEVVWEMEAVSHRPPLRTPPRRAPEDLSQHVHPSIRSISKLESDPTEGLSIAASHRTSQDAGLTCGSRIKRPALQILHHTGKQDGVLANRKRCKSPSKKEGTPRVGGGETWGKKPRFKVNTAKLPRTTPFSAHRVPLSPSLTCCRPVRVGPPSTPAI